MSGTVMTGSANRVQSRTQIADLRAGLRKADTKPAKIEFDKAPPKPKKQPKRENVDERAEKAERQAQQQHTTSLLKGGSSKKAYVRKGERPERKGTFLGLLFQLVLVVAVAGGVAYALDPSLVPEEWKTTAVELYNTYIPAQ